MKKNTVNGIQLILGCVHLASYQSSLIYKSLCSLLRARCVILALMIVNTGYAVAEANPKLDLSSSSFGKLDGKPVILYHLSNKNGMHVKITNYGATITSIVIPDAFGGEGEITAGFDSFSSYFGDEYVKNNPYFGGIVGRYASVIRDAKFDLNDKTYALSKNMGEHHLHGGVNGFDRHLWYAKIIKKRKYVALQLSMTSPDLDEGYPGNLDVMVEYRLNNKNELSIRYEASSDQDTPLSLTNHAYFNLNGFKDTILDHRFQLTSDAYLQPDSTGTVDGTLAPVANSATDFNTEKRIGDAFESLPTGFEHFYVFDNPKGKLQKVAIVNEPISGRRLEVLTTEPGTLLYTGRYTSNDLQREDGTQYGQFRAFCIETSKYPNGPNIEGSPRSILEKGDDYEEETVYRFSW